MRKSLVLSFAMLAACSGGGDDGNGPTRVATVAISQGSASLLVGDSVQLAATAKDGSGASLSGRSIAWTSSNAGIASVNATTGWVRGIASGAAAITAASEGKSAEIQVAISPVPVAAVELSTATLSLTVAGSAQLTATPKDARGNALAREITWATSDESKVRVNGNGLVTGVSAGSATVTATSESRSAQTQVTVGAVNGPVIASLSAALLRPGSSVTITGSNFDASAAANLVTIDGVSAAVNSATPTQLLVTLPPAGSFACEPTHNATVSVTVNGAAGTRQQPLQVATQRALVAGQSLMLLDPTEVRCNELSQTGGRYLVSVFNTNTSVSSSATFQLRGAGATVLNAAVAPNVTSTVSAQMTAPQSSSSVAALFMGAELQASRQEALAHRDRLERERALFRAAAPSLRARRAASSSVSLQRVGARASLNVGTVGDTTSIKIPNINASNHCSNFTQIRARTVYSGARAIILEDVAAPLAGTMDSYFQQIGQEFDNVMFPIITANFGNPLAYDAQTDRNGKILMLFSKQVNDIGRVVGFVTACDLIDPALTSNPASYTSSNLAEIFYAVAPTSTATGYTSSLQNMTRDGWRRLVRGTVIHEVKHLTTFAERFQSPTADVLEESWLEEGTAMHAEELYSRTITGATFKGNTGYGAAAATGIYCEIRPGSASCPADRPKVMFDHFAWLYDYLSSNETLSMLGGVGSSDGSFYGTSWAFVRWIIDQYSSDAVFLKSLIAEPHLTGVSNIAARTGRTYGELLGDFSLALALDDLPGFTPSRPQLAIPSWNMREIFAGLTADFASQSIFVRSPPLQARALAFGGFASDVATLRAGSAAYFDVAGSQAGKQLIEVRTAGGGDPPSSLRVAVVRIQ
ncbi:MAG: Ig-like domain-containing protein [Gemmatimonadaceae bacterium]